MISQIAVYLALIVVVLWTLRNPMAGVAAYWVLALARPQDVYWWSLGSSRLSLWVALVVCAVWLEGWIRGKHSGLGGSTVNWLVLGFLVLKGISAVFAADQVAAWEHMETVGKMVLFYSVTTSLVTTQSRFRAIALVAAISIGYMGLWGNWRWYVEGFGGGLLGELAGPGSEVQATFSDRNLFGYLLALGIPLCFFAFVTERSPWLRWPVLACLPFLANAVMLTFGRAAFLGMLAGSLCAVIRMRRLSVILGVGLVGALLIYRLAGPEVVARVMTIGAYDQDESAVSRLESWEAGLRIILDHPILGVGPNNYGKYSAIYNPRIPPGLVAHNDVIQTAAESGILSALVLVVIIALTFRNVWWVRRRTWTDPGSRWAYYYAAMIESCLVCYLVGAMFVSLPYFEPFYLLVGLSVCLRRIVGSLAEAPVVLEEPVFRPARFWWRRGAALPKPV